MVSPDFKKKIEIILISIFVTFAVLLSIYRLTKRGSPPKWCSVRPSDFPEILIAPESAEKTDFFEPPDATLGSYSIRFHINERYSPENTLNFIEKHLSSHGWNRLEHSLLNPNLDFIPYRKWAPGRVKSGEIVCQYTEDWLNNLDESIIVNLRMQTGRVVPDDAQPSPAELEKLLSEANNLIVILQFYEANSWVQPFILKYKELYPEEFNTNLGTTY